MKSKLNPRLARLQRECKASAGPALLLVLACVALAAFELAQTSDSGAATPLQVEAVAQASQAASR